MFASTQDLHTVNEYILNPCRKLMGTIISCVIGNRGWVEDYNSSEKPRVGAVRVSAGEVFRLGVKSTDEWLRSATGLKRMRRDWCLGGEEFKKQMLERMEEQLSPEDPGQLRWESAEGKAERIIQEKLE